MIQGKTLIVLCFSAGLLTGCALKKDAALPPPPPLEQTALERKEEKSKPPRDLIVLLPEADGRTGKIRVTGEGSSQVIDRPWFGVEMNGAAKQPAAPQPIPESEVREIFQTALEVHPDLPNRYLSFFLWFESGNTQLTPESRKTLREILKAARERKAGEIYLAGHTDRVGTEAHNLKLSSRRALYIRDFLVARGIKPGSLVVSCHGESAPLVQTEDEVPEPANRRVEVFIK